ncbi:bifunctional S-methyl-5-thioribose-1-phosphate isomerase/methylthioribulose 1-phosphate dehydratase [Nocardia seriolae]|uniref:Methylthioribose-1-phosphate isomerase n=1 Tax=Nocardia seriolae TaxID=37332 RepID=A0A0B8NEI8_9NOCA|nr:bifunctional S-methyl-5-thioribose-1-phosphate isomerase/methylthioribulose 1-phosphate dehydratase [Nocardia seriolae]MTJ63717.1 bifunctional S-methyl-5-thioribose-1-phosphate isomerase/methylthioribulose 1-phosphate dehydratase [Nocardia seriolae]MTJ75842.1 bifunctional S-methyl-5-thioribose-1-phosphate isomerase/methylthioribulose 1-phosphate dehydratase [Nocardia seriolae]MTJ88283.1 bifunctional S-methyl-5-thioribose-1-phosphate isomerase/methylthioribulose 1-phosphate dehydratase [Nocard
MDQSSIAWADGALVTIDQRALPHEVRELRITTVDEVIDAIKTLAVRGAPAIGVCGAFGVVIAALTATTDGVVDTARVESEAARIADARPTAVNLAWGVQRTLAKLPEGVAAMLDEALETLAEDGRVNLAAATEAADLIQRLCADRPLRLLTHCNTGRLATTAWGTAIGALRVLHQRGALAEVIVDETRPLLQGARLTAWEMAEAGIPHRLTIDSAAAWAMATEQVDAVVVGADRITADGAVANKIGTYMLAIAAKHHGIPFIVVAPESTRDISTAHGSDIVVEQRAAAEVTGFGGVATAPEGTRTFNPAFDVTPAELVTAVVTEFGVLEDPSAARTSAAVPTGTACTMAAGAEIADIARGLYASGWMPGTAGNISVRQGDTAVITASGLSKGELTAADMVTVALVDSKPVDGSGRKPSAETTIHTAVYRTRGAVAVVHVHPPHATAASIKTGGSGVTTARFAGYELIKGLGSTRPDVIDIPVFPNHADVPQIGVDIEKYLTEHPDAPPVLFIAGHGITAWGATLAQARDRAECLEAMCELTTLTGHREIPVGQN